MLVTSGQHVEMYPPGVPTPGPAAPVDGACSSPSCTGYRRALTYRIRHLSDQATLATTRDAHRRAVAACLWLEWVRGNIPGPPPKAVAPKGSARLRLVVPSPRTSDDAAARSC